ncbi:MAG: GMC family oxidoreductase N-terminal domain-containing protein [Alphaproteobacteria bacterium]|jgi:choline dehydrogenase|nr:GMC family oxidoreductase N-terminal domain-containing protein [Alphaproteobacteria bacterium]
MLDNDAVFDFIVSGAGSAGCAVAARLSESGAYSVLLLEAGPRDTHPWIHIPIGFAKVFIDKSVNWKLETEPVEALNNRRLYQPRGKVLGGSSSINGTIYIRGQPGDYDEWRQRGLVGWDWDSVLPFFKKAEDNARGADDLHGAGGPLRVSDVPAAWDLPTAMVAAAEQAGIPANTDFNGPEQEGTGFYQFTATNKRRWSTAKAYLGPAKGRRNLHVETQAHARRVLIEDGKAVGIEFQTPGGIKTARARREVIVSGGTFGSPQLLQLSGVGPGELLGDMGIEVKADLPGVGAHLRDHFNTYLAFRCAKPVTGNDLANSLPRRLAAGARYLLSGTGPLSSTGICAGAFLRSDPRLERPDIQINMFNWAAKSRTMDEVIPFPFSAFTLSPVHLRPDCDGSVRIKSPDPMAPPAIRYEFLRSEYDKRAILHGMRVAREIARQPALKDFMVEEVLPGPGVASDEEMLADVRERAVANYHPMGTCRMGDAIDSATDARLRVHGVDGLRVADASIMPSIVAGNTNAPTIMIGEKCAAMVLEDAR